MKRMKETKQKYDSIPIPEELSERIMLEVEKAEKQHHKNLIKVKRNSYIKKAAAAAAATAVLFTAGINTSEAFAKGVSHIPVLGALAEVVTFRSYETNTEDLKISVEIPSIEMISEDLKGLEKEVNEEIHGFCEQYAREAEERAEEYKQAFLETGGTKEEWIEHNITIKVWYEVKAQTDQYLSLAVIGTENWTNAYSETKYYNFDLKAGKWITLEDVLGDQYAEIAKQSIRRQAAKREEETGIEYWMDEWKGIDADTAFYMDSDGVPVIVLDQYEIAPGAAGQQEFRISEWEEEPQSGDNYEENGYNYVDSFEVPQEAIIQFAGMIKEAVAKKDIEKLADLTGFPVYVGFEPEGQIVESREEFTSLNIDQLFTDEMIRSIAGADESSLSPSMAGFTMYDKDGAPSITFGVQNGKLAVSGINY
ncbi:RsiV family protein [Candidatus Merdisoma sp. JLR.KK006]|uniref:RsiV family protein n=1 Tax=Candidatus Merdisoma sp. JLR.KK006 TaxID=3112626 RepID=UPI002FF23FD3